MVQISQHKESSMRPINMVRSKESKDMEPIVEAYIRGRQVPKAYVDGGAQICVMSEQLMNQLGLEVSGPSTFREKLANNVTVKCLGVIHDVKVKVCGIEVAVDTYVMPSKGDGYPIILGRPWLMAM